MALVLVGVCLFGLTVAVSIYVPLGDGDIGLGERLIEAFRGLDGEGRAEL